MHVNESQHFLMKVLKIIIYVLIWELVHKALFSFWINSSFSSKGLKSITKSIQAKTKVLMKPFFKNFELELICESIDMCFSKNALVVNWLVNQFRYLSKIDQPKLIHNVKNSFYEILSRFCVKSFFYVFQKLIYIQKGFQHSSNSLKLVRPNLSNHTYKEI